MANQFNLGLDGQLINGASQVVDTLSRQTYIFPSATALIYRDTPTIDNVTESELVIPSMTSGPGLVLISNLDPVNWVKVGKTRAGALEEFLVAMPAGWPPLVLLMRAGVVLRFLADTAPCVLDIRAYSY